MKSTRSTSPPTAMIVVCLGSLLLIDSTDAQTTVSLHPRAAYMRTNQDNSLDATAIALSSIGLAPGDRVRIRAMGEYSFNSSGSTGNWMGGVFSSTNVLLQASNLNRVPGAIDAGPENITGATFRGSLPTDIPEDFPVALPNMPNGVSVRVPPGAAYIFVAALDSLFEDNADADNDFGAEFTRLLCDADLDDGSGAGLPDGAITIDDLLYFLAKFEAGAIAADLDNDGDPAAAFPDGAVTVDDLLFFLARFEVGC